MQRGYVLTDRGIRKLEKKQEEIGITQERIALDVCLNRTTVSKAFQGINPLNKSSIRRLFSGLGLPLESTDYRPVGVSSDQRNLQMSDLDELKKTIESLTAMAVEKEANGNAKEAEKLRKEIENLEVIVARVEGY